MPWQFLMFRAGKFRLDCLMFRFFPFFFKLGNISPWGSFQQWNVTKCNDKFKWGMFDHGFNEAEISSGLPCFVSCLIPLAIVFLCVVLQWGFGFGRSDLRISRTAAIISSQSQLCSRHIQNKPAGKHHGATEIAPLSRRVVPAAAGPVLIGEGVQLPTLDSCTVRSYRGRSAHHGWWGRLVTLGKKNSAFRPGGSGERSDPFPTAWTRTDALPRAPEWITATRYFDVGITFDADNMVADLLAQNGIGDGLYEVVDGVDGRVDALEALDLLPDGQRVVPVRLDLIQRPVVHVGGAVVGWITTSKHSTYCRRSNKPPIRVTVESSKQRTSQHRSNGNCFSLFWKTGCITSEQWAVPPALCTGQIVSNRQQHGPKSQWLFGGIWWANRYE